MPPTVHLIRHAQGFHNLNVASHALHDPLLTPLGNEQCAKLSKAFPHGDDVDLVVASPLKRTIYTALNSFDKQIRSKNLKVILLPELQETSDLPCDTGSSPAELHKEFHDKPLDFTALETADGTHWNDKKGKWAPHADAIIARAAVARRWLHARPEKNIVVVTHGGFLHYFTEDWVGSDKYSGTGWANTEFRSYTFLSDTNTSLVETEGSRTRRSGHEKPLSKEEQKNLQRTTDQKWTEQGYVKARDIQTKMTARSNARDFGGYGY